MHALRCSQDRLASDLLILVSCDWKTVTKTVNTTYESAENTKLHIAYIGKYVEWSC